MTRNLIYVITTLLLVLIINTSCNNKDLTQADKDLLEAIRSGDTAKVAFLLEKNANVRSRNQHGNTALHLAASRGNCEIIEILIKNGAKVKSTDDSGNTALHEAAASG